MSQSHRKTALVTNAAGFAGPPAVQALLDTGFAVCAHDSAFGDPACWAAFQKERPHLTAVTAAEPDAIIANVQELAGPLSVLVSNDHWPAPSQDPATASPADLQQNYEKLVEFPFRMIQSALPALKLNSGGNIVMITSNRTRLPLSGGAFPDAARAAVNAMVRSLAIDLAPHDIIINAVAPNFLYSEAYYPAALFRGTEGGRAYVSASVPVGRLAEPHEIGEVIAFLATIKTRFMTGAILDFSGGWPFAPARPTI
jgi:3-oxoacyl-[acyl-carrier protein] reductase